ncbi:MAG: hypothetical protein WCH03_04965 [Flavobacteriia bacterium]
MRIPNLFKNHIEYLRFCLGKRHVKIAHFFLFVLLIYILIEWQHENNLYRNIGHAARIHAANGDDTSVVKEAMTSINDIMQSRHNLFQDQEAHSWKQAVFQSADIDLMYGSGACGGYSKVLARTLQLQVYDVRIGQLKTASTGYGGHIIIELYSETLNKWVFVDPLFKLIIRQKNGDWASVKEVAKHYNLYRSQMPAEFNARFKFDDVRYTNWDKYGGITKPYYALVKLFKGERYADTICLRMYWLSSFPVLFWSVEIVYLVLLGIGYWRWKRG